MVGYAPTPADFQSAASTKLASSPLCLQMDSNHRTQMRADLQSAAIATMRYRRGVPYRVTTDKSYRTYSLNTTTAFNWEIVVLCMEHIVEVNGFEPMTLCV